MSLKFSALTTNLIPALTTVARIVPSRATLPIVQNVLFESDQGMISISGTDLNASVKTKLGAMIEEEGAIAIPFRPMYDLVRSFPDDRIDIEVVESNSEKEANYVIIKSGNHTGRLNTANAKDFPPTEVSGKGLELSIPASQLEQSISKVKFSTATEDTRPVLKGIHIRASAEKQSITFAAADGFRLSVCEMDVPENITEDVKITVPRDAMEEVERLCGRTQGNITVTIQNDKGQVRFKNENTTIVSQILQGEFPNYEQLIPSEYNTRLSIDKKKFNQGINAAAALTRNDTSIARFLVTTGVTLTEEGDDETVVQSEDDEVQTDDETVVQSEDGEVQTDDETVVQSEDGEVQTDDETVVQSEDDEGQTDDEPTNEEQAEDEPAEQKEERYVTIKAQGEDVGDYSTHINVNEYDGTDNRVAINIRYLSDLDRQIKDDIIIMEITNQGSPVAFRSKKDSDVHVIMPISVKWP